MDERFSCPVSSILLVQTSFLGDTILSTPVIRGIKERYPDSSLWMMTTAQSHGLIKRDPLLAGTIIFDKRGQDRGIKGLLRLAAKIKAHKFDQVFSLHRSMRTALLLSLSGIPERTVFADASLSFLYQNRISRPRGEHEVIRNLSILGEVPSADDERLDLRLFAPSLDECSQNVQELFPSLGQYAVLVPGSEWNTKRWYWERFREVASYLVDHGMNVVIPGSRKEVENNLKVSEGLPVCDFTGTTTVSDAMFLIKNATLLVCNDSMSLHVGSAFKTPSVAVFCATSPEFGFGPWRNRAVIVEHKGLSCRPCRRHGSRKCPTGTEKCMRDLPSLEVIRAMRELW